jgi:hypothetical protein
MPDMREYFAKTLLQLFSHDDENVSALALQLSLNRGIQNSRLTLTELLEHPNSAIKRDALRLFREIESLEQRKAASNTEPVQDRSSAS